MNVRYRVVSKKNKQSGFYVNFDKSKVTIQAIDAALASMDALRSKLTSWYQEKGITFKEIPSNADSTYCFAWNMNPQTGEGMDTYYYAGGCGVGEYIEELEEARREAGDPEMAPDWGDISNFDDEYGYAPPLEDSDYYSSLINLDEEFQPLASVSKLDFFDDTPISVEKKTVEEKSTSKSSYSTPYQGGNSKGGYKGGRRRSKDPITEEGMILGPRIQGEIISISEIQDGGRDLVFEGRLNHIERRDLKTERSIISGNVVDRSNSIRFVKFCNSIEEGEALEKALKACPGVKVQGDVDFDDRYERDFVLRLKSVESVDNRVERTENRPDSRVELHLHTKMSDRDALVSVKDLLKTVKKWGHPAVAITDHGVVQTFPEAQNLAKELGVKVIYGVEGYLIENEESDKRYHIIILAKNLVGLRNLYKLISISHIQYFKRRPRLPRKVIEEHREGLIKIGRAHV